MAVLPVLPTPRFFVAGALMWHAMFVELPLMWWGISR